ncbi:MAG TPA: hypothetical protein VGR07_12655 [Thermoanaerobaculia bacterium]|jgi:hypothetical protein|nr:hypothetical protein [Thermoanaerobaculia bacterium]
MKKPLYLTRLRLAVRSAFGMASVAVLAGLTGCASSTSLHFRCDPAINEGLLLTVDLVEVSEAEVAQVRQAGDQWFYSDLRRQLEPRTRTVAVAGGCDTTVKLAVRKGYDTLAVISDYKSSGAATGSMLFRPKSEWQGKALTVKVGGTLLTIEGGR